LLVFLAFLPISCPFSCCVRPFWRKWINIDVGSFGMEKKLKRGYYMVKWSNEREKVAWAFLIYRDRTLAFFACGGGNLKPSKACGKTLSKINI
jgi:hypothetical protein